MSEALSSSALYFGKVMHKRLQPFVHAFSYRVFSIYLDLDEIEATDRRLRLFSHNRRNVFSFLDRDHGPRDGRPLKPWIEDELKKAGIELGGGKVRLLCFPRLLGYVFNPLSIWFCHHADGELRAVLYEVSNTFGEHHCYLLPVTQGRAAEKPVVQSTEKRFYVSPFIDMDSRYDFRLDQPGHRLAIAIRQQAPSGDLLIARHSGRRRSLTDANLLRAFVAYPLMTLKVIAAIHWEAARLWRKGARLQPRPARPERTVTLVSPTESALPGSHGASLPRLQA